MSRVPAADMEPDIAVLDGGTVDDREASVNLDAVELTVVMSDGNSTDISGRHGRSTFLMGEPLGSSHG
jgi:hypothetical protein